MITRNRRGGIVAIAHLAAMGLSLILGCSVRTDPVIRLNDEWQMCPDPEDTGMNQRWYDPGSDRRDWTSVVLPEFPSLGEASGREEIVWYARSFESDGPADSLQIVLTGAEPPADLWLNGMHVATTQEGGGMIMADLTAGLREGRNEIVVRMNGALNGPAALVRPGHVDDALRTPESRTTARHSEDWVRNAIVYSVYLRSFAEKQPLRQVEDQLPAIRKLGVTVLWLLPVHPIGEANRKGELGSPYAVRDYFAVNPEYGTLDDLKSLVWAAHREGMMVILDLVIGHTAWDSQLIFEYPEWFRTDKSGAIVSPKAEWSDVAALNLEHHELRKYLIGMMEYWVREVGIDGFRCDTAERVPLEFWELARRQLDGIRPVLMLAEGARPAYHREAFDMTYAENTARAFDAVLSGKARPAAIHECIRLEGLQYPAGSLRLRYYTNHDWNMWKAPATAMYGAKGARLLAALTYLLPGIPLVYNGEEVGSDVRLDLFQRSLIDWSDRNRTRLVFEELAAIRANPAFASGDYGPVIVSDPDHVLSFARTAGPHVAVVVANMSDRRASVSLEVGELGVGEWRNERGGSEALPGPFTLAPYEWTVFTGTRTLP